MSSQQNSAALEPLCRLPLAYLQVASAARANIDGVSGFESAYLDAGCEAQLELLPQVGG